MARKNVMRTFKIHEISAVDRPAQAGARMLIMKRGGEILDDDLDVNGLKKTEDGKQFPSSDYAYVPDPSAPSTWKMRLTKTPGGEPDSTLLDVATTAISESNRGGIPADAVTKTVSRLRSVWKSLNPDKQESDMPEGIKKSNPLNEGDVMTKEELDAMKAAHTAELAKKDAEIAKAKKVSDMTDAEKAKYNAMSDTDKEDFLGKSAEQRAAIIKNDTDANPVVYKSASGEEYRKNDDSRLVTMAKQSDDNAKLAKAEREARENSELKKRANDTFKNLPGTEDEKAALLKSIEAIPDEAVRKKALESVIAGDNALKAAFTRKGANDGSSVEKSSALDQLDALAKEHEKLHKCSYAKAYDTVIQTPAGRELYQSTVTQ